MKFTNIHIKAIKSGNDKPLLELYEHYRNPFIIWAGNNYGCNADDAKDIFQEILIAFYQNIINGKLTHLSSDVRTYLFAIGKNHLRNLYKKNSKIINLSDSQLINVGRNEIIEMEESEHNKEVVKKALERLPENCRKILKLFYFKGYDQESIAKELGYKNANVIKKKKSECMKLMAKAMKDVRKGMHILI